MCKVVELCGDLAILLDYTNQWDRDLEKTKYFLLRQFKRKQLFHSRLVIRFVLLCMFYIFVKKWELCRPPRKKKQDEKSLKS